jgi:hypothetical protein
LKNNSRDQLFTSFTSKTDRFNHLKLSFVAAKPPSPRIAKEFLMAAEPAVNISNDSLFPREERSVEFPALLSVPAASWPAFRYFELTLTSDHAEIYPSLTMGRVKIGA